jgi:site-specific DNA-cytosine methylase
MSNHCNCARKNERIHEDEVLNIESVLWHSSPLTNKKQLFIRQTWMDGERFVTLAEDHKGCQHHPSPHFQTGPKLLEEFPIGQTVLVMPSGGAVLDPFEVVKYIVPENGRRQVVLRYLIRRKKFDGRGRPNELIYTDRLETFATLRFYKKCLVRFYSEDDALSKNIPAPYCRDGTGNAFYICTRLSQIQERESLVPIFENLPRSLIPGFDPKEAPYFNKLRGMDLYCGGGNFGRGIEEGGAVDHEWAVDIYNAAIHTYRANLKDTNATKMFYGSVNDLLAHAMAGNPRGSDLIPAPGEVDFISAGSPCQGFSRLNPYKDNAKGLANQSLVASVAAYIDFYRPKYGLLENVLNMAQKGSRRDVDPLSQLICAIVGMGYQLQVFLLDAWSCGSPQSRSRIFVSFAAPGLEPLQHPDLSHAHPPGQKDLALGMLANGKGFGERSTQMAPFGSINIADATRHLPFVGDGTTSQCTKFPYHVVSNRITSISKQQITCIPTRPRGMNFYKTWLDGKGTMTTAERTLFPVATDGKQRLCISRTSKAWGRLDPSKLMSTVIVLSRPEDAVMGRCLHWDQHRIMTVAEAQVAQGFPDGEVLVGSPADWWKILGNSVCRTVAMSLGLSLREAWLKSASKEEQKDYSKILVQQQADHPHFLKPSINPKAPSTNDIVETSVSLHTGVRPEYNQFLPIRPPNNIPKVGSLLETRTESTLTKKAVPLGVGECSQSTIVATQTTKMSRIIPPPTNRFLPTEIVESKSRILTSTSTSTTIFSKKVENIHNMSSDDSEDPIQVGFRSRGTAGAFPAGGVSGLQPDSDDGSEHSTSSSSFASPEPSQEAPAMKRRSLRKAPGNASGLGTNYGRSSTFSPPGSMFRHFGKQTRILPQSKAAVNGPNLSGNRRLVMVSDSEEEDEISRAPTTMSASRHSHVRRGFQPSNATTSWKPLSGSVTESASGSGNVSSNSNHATKRRKAAHQVVIDLLSSDEEEVVKRKRVANQESSQSDKQSSRSKYVPVDNGSLRTNESLFSWRQGDKAMS